MRHFKFFHQFSFYWLPRWLRRKLKHLRSGFACIPWAVTKTALATVLVVGGFLGRDTQEAWGQTNPTDIGNHRSWTGTSGRSASDWNSNTSQYDTPGTAGTVGDYAHTGAWFGLSDENHVIYWLNLLNSLSDTERIVNISQLDIDSESHTVYSGGQDATGTPYTYRGYRHPDGMLRARSDAMTNTSDFDSTFGGTVNVASEKTTTLSAKYGYGGIDGTDDGQLFTIDNTLTKAQAGRLSIQTNTRITRVVGSDGTLDISGKYGKIASDSAEFNGGTYSTSNFGTYNDTANYTGALSGLGIGTGGNSIATFSFTSGRNTGTANSANTWTIDDPITSNGINNMGYIIVTGTGSNNTLNGVANIGLRGGDGRGINTQAQNGSMIFKGAVDFATAGTGNYININRGVLDIGGAFTAGTAADTAGTINHLWGGTFWTRSGAVLAEHATSNITVSVGGGSVWNNMATSGGTAQPLTVGSNGAARLNILSLNSSSQYAVDGNGGVVNTGSTVVAENSGSFGEINVVGDNSLLQVNGTLTIAKNNASPTADAKGNLYVWEGGRVNVTDTGANSMIIGDGENAVGRVYVDGYGVYVDGDGSGVLARSTLNVAGTLTVGRDGQAGGTYTEDRSSDRYSDDPEYWFSDPARTLDMSANNAQNGNNTGNNPGLAITRGAKVTSGQGVIGENDGSNGYVVIDNRDNTSKLDSSSYNPYNPVGTAYSWMDNDRPFYELAGTIGDTVSSDYVSQWVVHETLEVGIDGNAFQRVIHGGMLVTGLDGSSGDSTIIASGSGRGQLFVNGNSDAWGRSIFKSYGATVVGQGADGRGTLRIYDGAFGETAGLYIGATTDSHGEVFVDDTVSTLRIMADQGSAYYMSKGLADANRMKGTGIFGASHEALVWMDADAMIRLNGIAGFATGSVLHLDNMYKNPEPPYGTSSHPFGKIDTTHNPVFDAGNGRVNFTNARVEGIGYVTGKDGVHIRQSEYDTGQASIDPGLIYGWETKCEKDFYGDLYFGHTLNMTGNVITYFDIDAGFYDVATGLSHQYSSQDHIYVVADPLNPSDSVTATLSGTLVIHARLTDYYDDSTKEYEIVRVEGQSSSLPGQILREYDDVVIKPWRFFTGRTQEIRRDGDDDVLYVTMAANKTPFLDAATTYNERSLGHVLDSIYDLKDRRWLPFLRNFWYLEDPDFLEAYKLFGGEIRAHALLLPLQNPWTYAHDRNGFSRCTGHAFFGPQNRSCNITSGNGLWGSYILTGNSTESDGNAGEYDLQRRGFVMGYEKASKGGGSYAGVMFAYNQGKLDTWRADAKSDDFQLGLYHGKRVCETWEWKNYLGMGIQNYNMRRHIEMNLSHSVWNEDTTTFVCTDQPAAGHMISDFMGLSFAGSTELARPFHFGKCSQWTVRPYAGLDLMAVWQNRASEYDDFEDDLYEMDGNYYHAADLVALDYDSTRNIRIYGRPGIMLERGGSNGNFRAGVAYSFLMGGHRYTNVTNQFQFAGDKFNLRGVDDGSGFVTANVGVSAYLGKRKLSMICLDYAVIAGSHSTTHAGQLGFQRIF